MIKTVTLNLIIPADRTVQIALPPDIPDGPVEIVLVIAPISPLEQKRQTDQERHAARNILLTMPERAALPFPDEPTDVADNL